MKICANVYWLNTINTYIITVMRRSLLLICVSLIIGFLFGSTRNNIPQTKTEPDGSPRPESLHPEIIRFFSEPVRGRLDIEPDPAYGSTVVDAMPLYSLLEKPDSDFPTGDIHSKKPLSRTLDQDNFFTIRDYMEQQIDIDGDDKKEKIVYFSTGAGSSIPQMLQIVKNGLVVFEIEGSSLAVEEAYGGKDLGQDMYGPGFILTTQASQDRNGFRVRYLIDKDGIIRPLWQQRHAGLKF